VFVRVSLVLVALLAAACSEGDGAGSDAGAPPDGATWDGESPQPDGAAGEDGGSPPDDGGPDIDGSAPPPGTVERFADLPSPADGIALWNDPDGGITLLVGLPDEDALVRVAPDGSTAPFADVPTPRGLAVASDGTVLAGGSADGDPSTGTLWRVDAGGSRSEVLADGPGGEALGTIEAVAVTPGGALVLTDSDAYTVLAAAADGSSVDTVTTAVAFPNGAAFAAGGDRLLVASWTSDMLFALPYDASDGSFGRAMPHLFDVETVDGVAVTAGGALVLASSEGGLLRADPAGSVAALGEPSATTAPANLAFGSGPYGAGWCYVTDRGEAVVWRVWVGEAGAALPP